MHSIPIFDCHEAQTINISNLLHPKWEGKSDNSNSFTQVDHIPSATVSSEGTEPTTSETTSSSASLSCSDLWGK